MEGRSENVGEDRVEGQGLSLYDSVGIEKHRSDRQQEPLFHWFNLMDATFSGGVRGLGRPVRQFTACSLAERCSLAGPEGFPDKKCFILFHFVPFRMWREGLIGAV